MVETKSTADPGTEPQSEDRKDSQQNELPPGKPARTDGPVATEDVLSREQQKAEPLYAGRVWVYPKAVWGQIRQIKWSVLTLLLAIYYLAPWIRWDRGPDAPNQAILVDLPNRRGYFFWIEIWPQEVYYLTGILVLGSLALFLATSIGGRVWCGYTCPQTVWTDLFMWIERRIEGDRGDRIRLDKMPISGSKVAKKSAKHGAWLLISFVTGGAWIMYYKDAPTLVSEFFVGESSMPVYFFTALFTATTYLLAGWAREQVCTYMCPWPRFQAALLDEDSLVVTYRDWRGEPRKPFRKTDNWDSRGDCIDCKQCVAVCPTGIDIRDGLQLECIGCGLCIDACDTVMDRIGRPRGLIAFDTERNHLSCSAGGERQPIKILRLRTILYVVLISAIGLFLLSLLTLRSDLDLNVLHERNPLFVTLSDGSIRNSYTIKVLNKAREDRRFALSVGGLEGAKLQVIGIEENSGGVPTVSAKPDTVATWLVTVAVPRDQLEAKAQDVVFTLTDLESGTTASHDNVFRGP